MAGEGVHLCCVLFPKVETESSSISGSKEALLLVSRAVGTEEVSEVVPVAIDWLVVLVFGEM